MANNLGLAVKPVTETTPEEEERVADWINTDEYKEKNFARQALVINPAHACQPLGAELAPTASRGRSPSCTARRGAPPTTAPPSTATSASRPRRSPTP